MKKYFILLITTILYLGFSACQDEGNASQVESQKVSTGDELLLDDVNIGDMAEYDETPEDESESIDRAFENAPPLVPHTVKGMVDIRIGDNECLLCHMPAKAKLENATPIPKSHFIDYRPKIKKKGNQWLVDAEENEVVAESTGEKLENARFFCNQCHVPQTDATVYFKNNFKAKFRNSSDKNKSNLDQNIKEGVE